MVLSALLFVLGFCCAALCALLLVPFVWSRAVRLTRQRLEGALPLSLKDIRADRDELRADFAVTQRRLEQKAEAARESEAAVRAENGQHLARIDVMTSTLADRDDRIEAFEELSERQTAEIADLDQELGETQSVLADARVEISGLVDQVKALNARVSDNNAQIDAQRVEIVALKTQSDNLSDLLASKTQDYDALQQRFEDAEATRRTGAARIASLERSLQVKERETARQAERLARIEADHAATVQRLRTDIERSSIETRDLQSRITIQAAESMRQGKRSTALEAQFAAAADELARMESQLHETERRAAAQIEQAREALRIERDRRHAVARELAEVRGVPYIEPKDSDALPIKPFEISAPSGSRRAGSSVGALSSGLVNGRQTPVAKVRVGSGPPAAAAIRTGSRVVKPSVAGLNAPNGANGGKPAANGRDSIADRVSRLKSELTPPDTAAEETAHGSEPDDPKIAKLTNSELQTRIRDLANRFSVFDTEGRATKTKSGKASPADGDEPVKQRAEL